jgi:hypothetical protein
MAEDMTPGDAMRTLMDELTELLQTADRLATTPAERQQLDAERLVIQDLVAEILGRLEQRVRRLHVLTRDFRQARLN